MSDEEGSKSPSPHRIAQACFAAAAAAPFLLWLTEWAQGHFWLAILVIGACESSLAVLMRFWPAVEPRFLTPDAAFPFSFRKHYLDDLVYQNRTLDMKGFTIPGPYALDMEHVFVDVGIAPIAIRDASAENL